MARRDADGRRADRRPREANARSATRPRARHGGYTLLEVLVAFSVLALALTLLLGTLSGATRQVRWSADAARASLHAQSLLADVGVGQPLVPGQAEGELEDGRYRWRLDIAPYVDPLVPPPDLQDPWAPRLLQLRLALAWGDRRAGQRLEVESLRLVRPDPEAAP